MDRGQLSTSVFEAGLGVLFVLAVVAGFTVGVPAADTTTEQLDSHAGDVATVLANEPPEHADEAWLREATRSSEAFERNREALATRLDRLLAANLLYRLETPYGTVGHRRPADVPAGHATVPTVGGEVRIWIWHV